MSPIIIFSGWGMPGTVLHQVAIELEKLNFPVTVYSLPGFSTYQYELLNWEQLERWGLEKLNPTNPAIVAGWSLGGMLATLLAGRFSKSVAGLVTLASNPCFVQKADWKDAMPEETFNNFQRQAVYNIQRTLKRFTTLCTEGSENSERHAKFINDAQSQQPFYASSLLVWLEWLRTTDHRNYLRRAQCPVRHLLADNDSLVPISLADTLRKDYSWHDVKVMKGSHSFFLDYPKDVAKYIASITA